MKELGIDISAHRSKSVDEFAGRNFDNVLTVYDNAKESCPISQAMPTGSTKTSKTRQPCKAPNRSDWRCSGAYGTRSENFFVASRRRASARLRGERARQDRARHSIRRASRQ